MKRILAICLMLTGLCVPARAAATEPDAQSRLVAALETARARYAALEDYRSVFYKTEAVDGKLGPKEKIFLKFKKPFKIFMSWQNTHKKGLQVLYERGKHNNKLAIHQPGLLFGLAQVVFLEQSSPYVREGSASFDIEDAGIGTFLEDFSKAVEKGRAENKLKVEEKEGRFEATFQGTRPDDDYFAYRVAVSFDEQTSLPVKMDLYGWEEEPIGFYEYAELKTAVGENDPAFKQEINRRLYRVYAGS